MQFHTAIHTFLKMVLHLHRLRAKWVCSNSQSCTHIQLQLSLVTSPKQQLLLLYRMGLRRDIVPCLSHAHEYDYNYLSSYLPNSNFHICIACYPDVASSHHLVMYTCKAVNRPHLRSQQHQLHEASLSNDTNLKVEGSAIALKTQ